MLNNMSVLKISDIDNSIEEIRNFKFDSDGLSKLFDFAGENDFDTYETIAYTMISNNFEIPKNLRLNKDKFINFRKNIATDDVEDYLLLVELYASIFNDLTYFPIPKSTNPKTKYIGFENSFMDARSFGGERSHEGTDIMALENVAGKYPIVSMCEGVVEQVGWLKLGGYRIGIRSPNGLYMYYAHLDSYVKEFKPGDYVKAGEMLGYMGDTGYSEIEGTKGNFPVHLHLGIYYDYKDTEISINPYYILLYLKNNLLYYSY